MIFKAFCPQKFFLQCRHQGSSDVIKKSDYADSLEAASILSSDASSEVKVLSVFPIKAIQIPKLAAFDVGRVNGMYQICLRVHRQDNRIMLQRSSTKYQPVLSLRQLNLKLKYVDKDR